MALKDGLKAIRRKIIRKEMAGKRKYVVVFGRLRFPYETHYEVENNDSKKYITIKGVELCFKKSEKQSKFVFSHRCKSQCKNESIDSKDCRHKISCCQ